MDGAVKSIIRNLMRLVVLLILVCFVFWVVPRLVYRLPPFHSWVAGQVEQQSGGRLSFDSIQGNAFEAELTGVGVDLTGGKSQVVEAKFDRLAATFVLLPLVLFRLDLKELKATGGEIVLRLVGGEFEQVRFPVSAEKLTMSNGRLVIQNLQGYECALEGCQLTVFSTEQGKRGEFTAARGKVGLIDLAGISGSYEFSPQGFAVTAFQATLPGSSSLKLDGNMALNQENLPIQNANLMLHTRNVKALLSALGYSERFDGSAYIKASFSGRFRPEVKDLKGSGTAQLSGISAQVDLPNYPGFEDSDIFNALSLISGMGGDVTFELQEHQVKVSSWSLTNENMKISGTLNIGYDKQLSGKNILLASPALAAGIPRMAQDVFQKNAEGWTEIPFNFKGTTNVPASDAGSVVAKTLINPVNAIKRVGGILGGLFGGREKKDKPVPPQEESQ